MKPARTTILVFIIILFHLVGLAGFAIPAARPLFLKIVPFHLLLMLLVVCLGHIEFGYRFLAFMLTVALTGFSVEWLGVHTGIVFGNYRYDGTLGLKLNDIPLIIAVNWFLVVYATGVTLQHLRVVKLLPRLVLGAWLMVLLDVVIEPAAVRYNYWHWQTPGSFFSAPTGNYVSWFAVSVLMLGIFEQFRFKRQSIVGMVLLLAQFVFFGMLWLVGR